MAGVLSFASDAHSDPWVTAEAFGRFRVVVDADSHPAEQNAARLFADLWRQATGQVIAVSHERTFDGVNVWIGARGTPYLQDIDINELGAEEYVVRTVEQSRKFKFRKVGQRPRSRFPFASNHVQIIGGSPRGTLYGVFAFFRESFGMRWCAPDVSPTFQANTTLRSIELRYEPALAYRDVDSPVFADNPAFAVAQGLNGASLGEFPQAWGGNYRRLRSIDLDAVLATEDPAAEAARLGAALAVSEEGGSVVALEYDASVEPDVDAMRRVVEAMAVAAPPEIRLVLREPVIAPRGRWRGEALRDAAVALDPIAFRFSVAFSGDWPLFGRAYRKERARWEEFEASDCAADPVQAAHWAARLLWDDHADPLACGACE